MCELQLLRLHAGVSLSLQPRLDVSFAHIAGDFQIWNRRVVSALALPLAKVAAEVRHITHPLPWITMPAHILKSGLTGVFDKWDVNVSAKISGREFGRSFMRPVSARKVNVAFHNAAAEKS